MDPNRLHLNFPSQQTNGASNLEDDRTYSASDGRIYPTTPSTFPQSVFPSTQGGHQDYLSAQMQSPTGGNYAGGAPQYFAGAQYGQQQHQNYTQQAHYAQQYQQQVNQQFSPRTYHANDPNAGLAHQFSNQNLGAQQTRQQSPFGRQPTPYGQPPPRSSSQQQLSTLLSPNSSTNQASNSADERPPEQDFNKYSSNIAKRVIGLHIHVEAFFTDNITRARERNMRYVC